MLSSSTHSHGKRLTARDLTAPWRHIDGILLAVVMAITVMGGVHGFQCHPPHR